MKRGTLLEKGLWFAYRFVIVFFLVAFVVSISFLLFFDNTTLSREIVAGRARATFFNVIVLCLLLTVIDAVHRYYTVERPAKRIIEATDRMTMGDFSVRIQPLNSNNSVDEFDVIIRNFNLMADELAGIETLRVDFFANVSHELKTPLAIIQNYATMLQAGSLPEETRQEYVKTIIEATHRFSEMITNILKLNKLENQQIFPTAHPYNVSEQLRECLLNYESVWESKQLDIILDIADDIELVQDEELMTLVWNNLFSNAMKFTPDGGTVQVILYQNADSVIVKVRDTGCGMNAQTGRHIFEKFYQGDTSHATKGNGLGLALVKRIIDIIGAEISVESEINKGTTFTVVLAKQEVEPESQRRIS